MIMIRIFIVKFTSRLNIWAMTINGTLCRARHKVLLLPKPLLIPFYIYDTFLYDALNQ